MTLKKQEQNVIGRQQISVALAHSKQRWRTDDGSNNQLSGPKKTRNSAANRSSNSADPRKTRANQQPQRSNQLSNNAPTVHAKTARVLSPRAKNGQNRPPSYGHLGRNTEEKPLANRKNRKAKRCRLVMMIMLINDLCYGDKLQF